MMISQISFIYLFIFDGVVKGKFTGFANFFVSTFLSGFGGLGS